MAALLISTGLANAQCPPVVGADRNCGVVLTILDIGAGRGACSPRNCITIANLQGPYDGNDDTLVGIVNNSNVPIASIKLTSGNPIFGFDGDGLCAYITCTWPHPSGYEGPGVTFSPLSSTTGTVNFNPPIAAGKGACGGSLGEPCTAYFSLEASLTNATACTSVINNSVHHVLSDTYVDAAGKTQYTTMNATFTSNAFFPYTRAQAAALCGFVDWDWQQTVTSLPPGLVVTAAGSSTPLTVPFNDPPLSGWPYQTPPNAVGIPVYWNFFTPAGTLTHTAGGDETLSLADNVPTAYTMSFQDRPTAGAVSFTTHLAGIVGPGPTYTVQDTGVGFSWKSTFNGVSSGGIHVFNSTIPVVPGSGTGGIAVTMVNDVSSYQYPKSFGVTGINGDPVSPGSTVPPTLLGGSQIAVTSSGLAYSRATQTFNGIVTITNISSSAIDGPFQIVFDSLTAGVTLTNATSSFGGWPYISVPASLAPGQSASVNMQFRDVSNAVINASPVIYSGSFN